MDITSGGGGRDRLAPSLAGLDNNLFGSVDGATHPEALAQRLVAAGWSARKAAWDEFEIANEWCSFLLVPDGGQVSISGVIAPERLPDLEAAFNALGLGYGLEVYSGEHLVREAASRSPE